MEIVLTIPDEVREETRGEKGSAGVRHLLEHIGVELYKAEILTGPQLQEMLGLTRFELDGVLKAHDVLFDYSPDELAREAETSRLLFASSSGK